MSLDPEPETFARARREFALMSIRWARRIRRLWDAIERSEQIRLNNLYECVGGPLDGKSVLWAPYISMYRGRGVYDLGRDQRLHYHELASSWFEKPKPFNPGERA